MKKIILPLVFLTASATFGWSQFARLEFGKSAAIQTQGAFADAPPAMPARSGGASLIKTALLPTAALVASGQFRDGSYRGVASDAYYGLVQVEADVKNGQLVAIKILQYPNDRNTSRYINSQALPMLNQEAIQAQQGQVDTISGATLTSDAYVQSLTDALNQASASGSPSQGSI